MLLDPAHARLKLADDHAVALRLLMGRLHRVAALPPLDKPIPNDENHLHFGAGQTEATVTLPRGRHTLQLLLGDAAHVPHDPPVYSKVVVVYVGMSPPAPPRVRHHRRSYFHGRA